MINKYIKSLHVSECQTRTILKHFSLDFEATIIASLTGISRQTINRILTALRERIFLSVKEKVSSNKDALSLTKATLAQSESVVNAVVEQTENISCLV